MKKYFKIAFITTVSLYIYANIQAQDFKDSLRCDTSFINTLKWFNYREFIGKSLHDFDNQFKTQYDSYDLSTLCDYSHGRNDRLFPSSVIGYHYSYKSCYFISVNFEEAIDTPLDFKSDRNDHFEKLVNAKIKNIIIWDFSDKENPIVYKYSRFNKKEIKSKKRMKRLI